MEKYEIIKFKHKDFEIDVRFDVDNKTIWMTQKEMSRLFDVSVDNISLHIKNAFKAKTKSSSVVEESSVTATDGKRYLTKIYSLEMVELIGQKCNSNIANIFINWCLMTLNEIKNDCDDTTNIIRFNQGNISLDVNVSPSENTVYLNQNQIAILFETTRQNISLHIRNIIKEQELILNSVSKDYLHTGADGKVYSMTFYNLDMILAIGYRIKGKRAIEFRKWASGVLKEYLYKGYVLDDDRTLITKENYVNLVNRVDILDKRMNQEIDSLSTRMDKIEEKEKHLLVEDVIVFENNHYSALSLLVSIIETATSSIAIIDPYVDIRTLNILKNKQNGVSIILITSNKAKISSKEIGSFNEDYGGLSTIIDNRYHDRYLIIDDEVYYHIGGSINHLGKRFTEITKKDEPDIIEILKKRIDEAKTRI